MAHELTEGAKEQLRRLARQRALESLERLKGGPGDQLSDEEAMAIALDAQRTVRRQMKKRKRGYGRTRK